MTQKIYSLAYCDDENGLKYININDVLLKKISILDKNIESSKYKLETIDNITSFFSEDSIKKVLGIKTSGNFLIISKKDNKYYKRHVLFDDEEIFSLTNALIWDEDYHLRELENYLKNEDFVSFLDKEASFYHIGNQKMKDVIHKLNCIYSINNEDYETEIEKEKLINYYSKSIDSYLKYRDFYLVVRDYEDKKYIKNNDSEYDNLLVKKREYELQELEELYLLDEINFDEYLIIKNSIIDEINKIMFNNDELIKTKKRIIKK